MAIGTRLRGNIPAHVGKTQHPPHPSLSRWKHPRSRGENCTPRLKCPHESETSPLTRGKLRRTIDGCATRGNIPAHAGKTAWAQRDAAYARKHPRSRGENLSSLLRRLLSEETSPLTRGKLENLEGLEATLGNIPAHAGKTALR